MKNRIGTISLLIATAGFITLESLLHFRILEGRFWQVICAGFEAGTVGAMADWFAVSALFREIPIPYVRKHTNIIAKNRDKMTESVVDLVTNHWLAPQVIREKLEELDFVQKGIDYIRNPEHQASMFSIVQKALHSLTLSIEEKQLVVLLKKLISEQVAQIDIGKSLGTWLEKSIQQGDHLQIWDQLLEASAKTLNHPDTRNLLLKKLEQASDNYANQSWSKKIMMTLGKSFNAIDLEQAVDELMMKANEFIRQAKNNEHHPVRQRFDTWLLDYANRLTQGEAVAKSQMDTLLQRLLGHSDLDVTLVRVVNHFKTSIEEQLRSEDSNLMVYIKERILNLLSDLEKNQENRSKANTWINNSITSILEEFHIEIGNMVRSSLDKLNNQELVQQIEEKVGDDLQYIRLNGAIVGGLVGILTALIKLAFTYF